MEIGGQLNREVEVVVSKTVERAQLGTLISHRYGLQSAISCLAPYVKSQEDIEVVLRNRGILDQDQPIEMCGITLNRILSKIANLEYELGTESSLDSYVELAKIHPITLSFPNEALWLAGMNATTAMSDCIADTAMILHRDWEEKRAIELGQRVQELAIQHRKSHGFWKAIQKESYDGSVLSRHLIEWTIMAASRARAKYLAGLTPIIDTRAPGSLTLSGRYNHAYLRTLAESSRPGLAPHYLYTLNLSPRVITRKWTEFLVKLLRVVRAEISTGEFDGIHLSLRNLKTLSYSSERVAVAKRLVGGLADIARDFRVPLHWSRASVAGLVGMDEGVTVSSFALNLSTDDLFLDGFRPGEDREENHYDYGSTLNPWTKKCLKVKGVKESGGLPDLGGCQTLPTADQLGHARAYRVGFSRPYNMKCLCVLSRKWQEHIINNDVRPGKEYVADFELPWCNWSA